MTAMKPIDIPDKDEPLREDIRLLGRVLGDTIRKQEGAAVFSIVENIRQTSIRFRRDEDEGARRELEQTLDGLSPDYTILISRAFSYFSHLSNIAEDQHHIRRTRAHALAASAPREGTLAYALTRAREAGIGMPQLKAFFGAALVVPVLTAHPTEVRRRSTINREMEVAELLAERDRSRLTPEEGAASDEILRRAVLTLWQTSLLRRAKLDVIDEVANGLAHYDYTFLRELPRLYAGLEDHLAAEWKQPPPALPSFLRMGTWIGGDRDGNPFVTADVLRSALGLQSKRAFDYYLKELHQLGGELSLDARRVGHSEDLKTLAERSPDRSERRIDEPYRRAITGIYARLAATAWKLDQFEAERHAVGEAAPYSSATELLADLETLHRSLTVNGSEMLARGRLRHLRRAVDVFGFYLASIDLRQNADVHERVVAELFETAAPDVAYLSLDEDARVALLTAELRTPRPLASGFIPYSDETAGELAIVRATAALR